MPKRSNFFIYARKCFQVLILDSACVEVENYIFTLILTNTKEK